jgi:cytochrome c peroxidase
MRSIGRVFIGAGVALGVTLAGALGTQGSAVAQAGPEAKARLGRMLFEDAALSEPPGQACATCHAQATAFTDPDHRQPTSKGVRPGLAGDRNAPTLTYVAFSPRLHFDAKEALWIGGQFWDGRAATLEEQAKQPFLNPREMANPSPAHVIGKLRVASYAPLFREVYGADALDDSGRAFDHVADALAAFQRTPVFSPFTSKYDAYLDGRARLTAQELRGLRLFEREDKGNCAACHPIARGDEGRGGLGTDFSYDNLGVPKHPANPFYRLPPEHNPAGVRHVDHGLGAVVGEASEYGKFKVPTVRNVALTAPYMHNGYFESLRALVDFYNTRDVKPRCEAEFVPEAEALARGCWPRPEMVANVNTEELGNLRLTAQEVDDIVAFMLTLTDGWHPAGGR